MSIWSSIDCDGPDVLASNLGDPDADNYAGTGPNDLSIDVATTTWHETLRLSVMPADGGHGLDIGLLLNIDHAERLAARLTEAVARIRARRKDGQP